MYYYNKFSFAFMIRTNGDTAVKKLKLSGKFDQYAMSIAVVRFIRTLGRMVNYSGDRLPR